jgi:hypothetical protein
MVCMHGSDIHVMLTNRVLCDCSPKNAYPSPGSQQQAMVIRDECPRCKSLKYNQNGHIHNGKQNHYCHACGRQFVRGFEQYLIAEEKRTLIARLLLRRISLRGICCAVGGTLK